MLQFMRTALSHLTGQAFNKPIFGSVVGSLASTALGSLMGGNDGPSPTVVSRDPTPFTADSGLFNVDFSGDNLTTGLDPRMQGLVDSSLANAGLFSGGNAISPYTSLVDTAAQDFLGNIGSSDPMKIAQEQFGLLSPILNKDFDDRAALMESRLFKQGRLGQTGLGGGNDQMAQIEGERQDALQKLLFNSLDQGMRTQAQNVNTGLTLAQANPQLQGMFSQLANPFINRAMTINNAPLELARLTGGLTGANTTASGGGYSNSQAFGQGLFQTGLEGLGQSIPQGIQNWWDRLDWNTDSVTSPF